MPRTVYSVDEIKSLIIQKPQLIMRHRRCMVDECKAKATSTLLYDNQRDPITIELCEVHAELFEKLLEAKRTNSHGQ